jgi:hypothetical protein
LPPLGVKLQQVASEDQRQRQEGKEDQAAQSSKEKKL